jgi:hypothetical protein
VALSVLQCSAGASDLRRKMMTTPPEPPIGDARLLRLQCPHCKAEYPLWFRPDPADEKTLTQPEWETWLDTECRECGLTPRDATKIPPGGGGP